MNRAPALLPFDRSGSTCLQPLEPRVMLALTPAAPRADTLGTVFDAGERADLLARLTHLDPTTRSALQSKLSAGVGGFDSSLLGYMRSRTTARWFVDVDQMDETGAFIVNNNIDRADVLAHADAITESRLFPEQGNAGDYTVQMPASINWVAPGGSTNPEFIHTMSRMEWQRELSWAAAITGDAKYAAEMEYQIASWSQQFTRLGPPAAWSASDREGWLLDTSLRAESWSWSYFSFLGNTAFSGAENALLMYKLIQHGDYLYSNAIAATAFESNKTIVLGKALLYLGVMFPEVDNASLWESAARQLLFRCMDAQIYGDGSHVEQSPGYAYNVSNDLLDARQLDRVNNNAWPKDQRVKLANIVESYWQSLSPNGRRPAIGDSFRNQSQGLFLKPNLILETTRWPSVRPATRDVFIGGVDAVSPFLNAPRVPDSLGMRGKTYAMPDSGNYVMRSGDSKNAVQINFDAGPRGGSHGHYDLLGFELSGFGRPLISDPGPYKYDTSADRKYVVSTRAHNTINVDGANHAALEGSGNPDIVVSQWRTGADFAQVTAAHRGYRSLSGNPTVARSIWYDLAGTILVVDWGQSSVRHNFQQSFNLATEGSASNVAFDLPSLAARTKHPSGGNVRIQAVAGDDGETAAAEATFVSNSASGDYKDDAYRFTLNQSGKFAVMVTLITAYNGNVIPDTSAVLLTTPSESGAARVRLTRNGSSRDIEFARPALYPLDSQATTRGTFNDLAFDGSGRLHMAYADRDTGALMYAVRSATGTWSIPTVIDPPASPDAAGGFLYISLALDNASSPAVAYFDGWTGDLRYAAMGASGWSARTLDSKGSTGLYPSLAFGRDNLPAISFYNRSTRDLMLARSSGSTFSLMPIDTAGDVGRASSLVLDPNRKSVTRWTVGYEDTANGAFKYALEGDFDGGTRANGFTNWVVQDLAEAGGDTALGFYDRGADDSRRYKAAKGDYDAGATALRFARSTDGRGAWSAELVASKAVQGLYTNLLFNPAGAPSILYFDRTNNRALRATQTGSNWAVSVLGAGGREIHTATDAAGNLLYSSLNESDGTLKVLSTPL